MIRLPLTARELTLIGNNRRTYVLRFAVISVALAGLLIWWLEFKFSRQGTVTSAEAIGSSLAHLGVFIQCAIVFFGMPALAGPLIADERRNNTLDLLLLADFRGSDIFFSKFIAAFAEAELLLLSTLPFMGFGALFGGISVSLIVKQWFVLSLCGATLCSFGLLCSSLTRHPISAIALNLLTALALIAGNALAIDGFRWMRDPWWGRVIPNHWWDPENFYVAKAVVEIIERDAPLSRWWPSLASIGLAGVAAALLTMIWLPRATHFAPRFRWTGPAQPYGSTHRRLLRQSPVAPFISTFSSGFASRLRTNEDRFIFAAGLAAIAMVPVAGISLVLLLVCYDITLSLRAMQQEGGLDDLAVTRWSEKRIARDIYRFHLRRVVLYAPALAVVTLQIAWSHVVILQAPVLKAGYTYVELLEHVPPWGVRFYLLAMIFFVPVFWIVQGPSIAAVACLVGASGQPSRRRGARAVILIAALYGLSAAWGTGGQLLALRVPFVRAHPWIPGIAFGVISILAFSLAGIYCYRRFVNTLSPRSAG